MKLKLTMKTAKCDGEMFDALPEYSTSIPTGALVAKRWKRNYNARHSDLPADWWLGEFYELPGNPEFLIGIRWRPLRVCTAEEMR